MGRLDAVITIVTVGIRNCKAQLLLPYLVSFVFRVYTTYVGLKRRRAVGGAGQGGFTRRSVCEESYLVSWLQTKPYLMQDACFFSNMLELPKVMAISLSLFDRISVPSELSRRGAVLTSLTNCGY